MLNDITARYLRAITKDVANENQRQHIVNMFFEHLFFATEYVASAWAYPEPHNAARYKARACVSGDRAADMLIKNLEKTL